MRYFFGITLALFLLLGAYFASPLIALRSIASAVESGDAVALTERIDFPSVRRSFKKQIVAEYLEITGRRLPLGAFARRLAVSVADPVVARLMTVRALLDLLGKGEAGKTKLRADRAPFTTDAFKSVWRLWLNADYSGRDFYVYLPPEGARSSQFRIHLRPIRWRWMVVGIELPQELTTKLARELIDVTEDRLRRAR
jgi:hypothetical protein